MSARLLLVVIASLVRDAAAAAGGVIKLPIEVDQNGKTVDFETDDESDVELEAFAFCNKYLPKMPEFECIEKLVAQVETIRGERKKAMEALPGLPFTVNDPSGNIVRFVHEEGANPAVESRAFCAEHFPDADAIECVEAMLANAAKALDEVQARYKAKQEL